MDITSKSRRAFRSLLRAAIEDCARYAQPVSARPRRVRATRRGRSGCQRRAVDAHYGKRVRDVGRHARRHD